MYISIQNTLKALVVLSMLLLAFVVLIACGSGETVQDEDDPIYDHTADYADVYFDANVYVEIIFEEPDAQAIIRGAVKTAQINTRRYLFPTYEEERNREFILRTEEVVQALANFIRTDNVLRIIYEEDASAFNMGFNQVHIIQDSINTYGFIANALSFGRLPMWLAIGLEAVARGNIQEYPLDMLSDIYFAPFLWDSQKQRNAVSTAYKFTNHLLTYGYFEEIVLLYMTSDADNIAYANSLSEELFYQFSGFDMDTTK